MLFKNLSNRKLTFKAKIKTMYCGVYNIWRSTVYDKNCTKAGRREWKYTVVRILWNVKMSYIKVDTDKS